MKEALFYTKQADQTVQCQLCPHNCTIRNANSGLCGVRKNIDGVLYTLVYGKAIAEHADPIEKKPLFHFYPGSLSFSIATVGCNLRCQHCQNFEISQMPRDRQVITGRNRSPEQIVQLAQNTGCTSIAYTYTEPTIYYEYAFETACLARAAGLHNVFVTNGHISPAPLKQLAPYADAVNIDLKSFSDDFYRTMCGARLDPVLDSIKAYRELGVWTEITTLVIPSKNDSDDELSQIASFIADLGVDIPWHVTGFYPAYELADSHRTPSKVLSHAREIGKKAGLRYVYTGNVRGDEGENTYCHACGALLVQRAGFRVLKNIIVASNCPECGVPVSGAGI